MTTRRIPRVLSIAGADPSGGAGIQADLKSIAANGGYGMAVVTALTAQNTRGVRSIHQPPVEFLTEQLEAISEDVEIDAIKLGMLFDTPVIETVSAWLQTNRPPVVVLDPVMIATSGHRLLTPTAEDALRQLLRQADLVTPNLPELAALLATEVATTWEDALGQASELAAKYQVRVLAKGGHLSGPKAFDALVSQDGSHIEFSARRVVTNNTHGTGCSLSSAVATNQARLGDWAQAIRVTKAWLTESIEAADELEVGQGNGPISHFAGLWSAAAGNDSSLAAAEQAASGEVISAATSTSRAERIQLVHTLQAERLAGEKPPVNGAEIMQQWWTQIADIRNGIDKLAFIKGLADGSLPQEAFGWYIAQDALYLQDYSRALAAASQLAPTSTEQAFWASNAHGAIATELELHANWLPADSMFDATPSTVTTGYLNHLLASVARGSYPELIAALLPCFWLYEDVGSRLVKYATEDHPYANWLHTYSDPSFQELNRQAIEIVATHVEIANPQTRQRMWEAFKLSSQWELDFFAAPLQR